MNTTPPNKAALKPLAPPAGRRALATSLLTLGLVGGLGLIQSARADTTITTGTQVDVGGDPNATYFNAAGTITR